TGDAEILRAAAPVFEERRDDRREAPVAALELVPPTERATEGRRRRTAARTAVSERDLERAGHHVDEVRVQAEVIVPATQLRRRVERRVVVAVHVVAIPEGLDADRALHVTERHEDAFRA